MALPSPFFFWTSVSDYSLPFRSVSLSDYWLGINLLAPCGTTRRGRPPMITPKPCSLVVSINSSLLSFPLVENQKLMYSFASLWISSAVNCTSQTIENALYPSVISGTNSTGRCDAGYFGNPILACVQVDEVASFANTQLGTPCAKVYCENATVDSVNYTRTQAGETAYGVCPTGYSGFPTRLCEQNQDTASFSANLTSGSCQSQFLNAHSFQLAECSILSDF